MSPFLNIRGKSASFHLFGNSVLIKQSLNIAFSVSGQIILAGMTFDMEAFIGLIRFSPLPIPDKFTLFSEKCGILFNLLLIITTLGWFL